MNIPSEDQSNEIVAPPSSVAGGQDDVREVEVGGVLRTTGTTSSVQHQGRLLDEFDPVVKIIKRYWLEINCLRDQLKKQNLLLQTKSNEIEKANSNFREYHTQVNQKYGETAQMVRALREENSKLKEEVINVRGREMALKANLENSLSDLVRKEIQLARIKVLADNLPVTQLSLSDVYNDVVLGEFQQHVGTDEVQLERIKVLVDHITVTQTVTQPSLSDVYNDVVLGEFQHVCLEDIQPQHRCLVCDEYFTDPIAMNIHIDEHCN